MKTILSAILVSLLLWGTNTSVLAQGNGLDPMSQFISDMLTRNEGKTLCSAGAPIPSIRATVGNYLIASGSSNTVTPQVVATALWNLFPCPFSPTRQELRKATRSDIEGVWLFPESSQKLRFGPRSQQQSPAGPVPVKCDAVGYYSNGELRHAIIAGVMKCPFERAADLDIARRNPRVSDWSLLREGRVGVTRTDVANHIEEWEVYSVIVPFTFNDVQFFTGDLVAYVRRENGNEVEAATQFRHLKRLP